MIQRRGEWGVLPGMRDCLHAPLIWREADQELWSKAGKLAYPVRDGIPVMLEEEARTLSEAELDQVRD